jgi:hypothetical protein
MDSSLELHNMVKHNKEGKILRQNVNKYSSRSTWRRVVFTWGVVRALRGLTSMLSTYVHFQTVSLVGLWRFLTHLNNCFQTSAVTRLQTGGLRATDSQYHPQAVTHIVVKVHSISGSQPQSAQHSQLRSFQQLGTHACSSDHLIVPYSCWQVKERARCHGSGGPHLLSPEIP